MVILLRLLHLKALHFALITEELHLLWLLRHLNLVIRLIHTLELRARKWELSLDGMRDLNLLRLVEAL